MSEVGLKKFLFSVSLRLKYIVDSLLQYESIDVNKARADYGQTPLFAASEEGHKNIVDALLQYE